jgi:hypothetical protein
MKKVLLKGAFLDELPQQKNLLRTENVCNYDCKLSLLKIMSAHWEQGNYTGKWLQKVPYVKMQMYLGNICRK